jgi:hypothetical protein
LFENTIGGKRKRNDPEVGSLDHEEAEIRCFKKREPFFRRSRARGRGAHMASAVGRSRAAASMISLVSLILVVALPAFAAADGERSRYRVGLSLTDAAPSAKAGTQFSFTATSDTYEKLDLVAIDLPAGAGLNPQAMAVKCQLAETGTDAGSICADKFPQAKIGSGVLITSVLGRHTIRGDVYVVAPPNAPEGQNLVYYFPGGQIFGASAQTLFGRLAIGPQGAPVMALGKIQSQLSLPFGMSAALVEGTFTFGGQNGEKPFVNPAQGGPSTWDLEIRLGWDDTVEKTVLQPTVGQPSSAPKDG